MDYLPKYLQLVKKNKPMETVETNILMIVLLTIAAICVSALLFICKPSPERNYLINKINKAQSLEQLEKIQLQILSYLENESDSAAHQLFMDLYDKKYRRL